MIWINIIYTIKQTIIYIMSLILLNALTGSCIFICFKLLEKPLEKMGLIIFNRLSIALCVWMLFADLGSWMGQSFRS